MSGRVTLARIAEAAGLSQSTASRVLRNRAQVSPEAAAKVRHALRLLSVVPPEHLRAEGGARIDVVAVISPATAQVSIDPWEPLVSALTHQLFAAGRVALGVSVDKSSTSLTGQLRDLGVRQAIVVGAGTAAREAERLAAAGLSVLRVTTHHTGNLPALVFDASSAIDLAVRHLTQLGHRRLGLVVPDDGDAATRISAFRLSVSKRLFIEATRSQAPVAPSDDTLVAGSHAADGLIQAGCSALVACGPAAAMGTLQAARGRGLRVPDELSLVAVGSVLDADLLAPGLTQVGHDLQAAAEQAVELLGGKLAQPGASFRLPPELVLRKSAARVLRR